MHKKENEPGLVSERRIQSRIIMILVAALWIVFLSSPGKSESDTQDFNDNELFRQQSGINEASRASMLCDPEIRENHIMENLRYRSGQNVQVLRLLWWAQEPVPELRKELLFQWLSEKPERPAADKVKTGLKNMLTAFSEENVCSRIAEVNEVLQNLEQESKKRRNYEKIRNIKKTSGPSRDTLLNELSEAVLLIDPNDPNGIRQRQEIYTHISLSKPSEIINLALVSTLFKLWLYEPNQFLRENYLWPSIEKECIRSALNDSFVSSNLDPLLDNLKESEKKKRAEKIRSLLNPETR